MLVAFSKNNKLVGNYRQEDVNQRVGIVYFCSRLKGLFK